MPFDGNTFTPAVDFEADAAANVSFSPARFMEMVSDISDALTALKSGGATDAELQAAIAAVLNGAGVNFDTLKEVEDFATGINTTIAALQATDSAVASTVAAIEVSLAALNAHAISTANPHGVTKAQVGLGNADNTSDAAKPISTAAQAAIDLKAFADGTNITGRLAADVAYPGAGGGPNLNGVLSSGFHRLEVPTNGPGDVDYGMAIVARGSDIALQIVSDFASGKIAWRSGNAATGGGSWGAWRTFLHSGNFSTYAAPINSPALTGTPTAPTPATPDDSTKLATTAFVKAVIAAATAGVATVNGRNGTVTLDKTDVGLANVDNTADSAKPVSTAQAAADTAVASAASAALTAHTGNTSNPHGVTKAQVGLANVDNTADSAKPVSTAQAAADTAVANAASAALTAGLATKAAASHTHAIADTTGLQAALDAKAVPNANNFFSADQTISKANPRIYFDKTASGQDVSIIAYKSSILRWHMQLGNEVAESGSNLGSDFALHRYSDAGAYLGAGLTISRATGAAAFSNILTATGRITSNYDFYATGAAAAFNFDDTAGGRYYTLAGNSGNVALFVNAATPLIQFAHDRSTQYIYDSGGTARQIVHAGNISSYVTFGAVTGEGGTVTQATSSTTAVTLNKKSGKITTVSLFLADTVNEFTLNNSVIGADDILVLQGQISTTCRLSVRGSSAGSRIIRMDVTGTLSGVQTIPFAVVKVATS